MIDTFYKKKSRDNSKKCKHKNQSIIVVEAFDIHEVINFICCDCGTNITKQIQNTIN